MPTINVITETPTDTQEQRNYGHILKSSILVGGSSVANIVTAIVRAKATAILLGPAGFGLNGLYSSVSDVAQSIAGMGINSSGVRQIAEAAGTGDQHRVAETAAILRQTSLVLGLIGAFVLGICSRRISILTFGTANHQGAIWLLSLTVLFKVISNGQSALVQGMRRISDLAKMNVLGAVFGTVFGIPLLYFFRQNGIVPVLVGVAGVTVLSSWWYSQKANIPRVRITPRKVASEIGSLLKLGLAFMLSGFLTLGAAYCVRVLLLRRAGVEATGFYQAAWTLGGLYVGIILQAMGADFYPRLAARANDNVFVNRLVNEQTKVGVLLAAPGVLATLVFAPVVLSILYSAKFHSALYILRWISLGTLLQVVSWPMGFIVLAKGRQTIFLAGDFAWVVVYLFLTWVFINRFGWNGAGIAFFGSYGFHAVMNYAIARRLSSFRFSRENSRLLLASFTLIAILSAAVFLLPAGLALCIGLVGLLAGSCFSVRELLTSVSTERLPRPLRALSAFF